MKIKSIFAPFQRPMRIAIMENEVVIGFFFLFCIVGFIAGCLGLGIWAGG